MGKAYDIFPDAEGLVGDILRAAGITAGRVYPSVPKEPIWPLTTFARIGGIPSDRHALDYPRIQIDVWGENKAQAREQALLARLALLKAEGVAFASRNAFIASVEDDLGLTFQPDPSTGRDRYIFGMAFCTQSLTGLVT